MKSFIRKPVFIAALAFILGGLSVFGAQRLYDSRQLQSNEHSLGMSKEVLPNFDEFFSHDFFKQSRNPFKEMERLHNQMLKNFGEVDDSSDHFDSWFQKSFGGGNPSDFNIREDSDFVYYEIDSSQGVPKKVDVKVEHGQVTITGEIENNVEAGNSSSHLSSSFVRSFPAPDNVDAGKFQVENEDKKIVVKFPKVKSPEAPTKAEKSI